MSESGVEPAAKRQRLNPKPSAKSESAERFKIPLAASTIARPTDANQNTARASQPCAKPTPTPASSTFSTSLSAKPAQTASGSHSLHPDRSAASWLDTRPQTYTRAGAAFPKYSKPLQIGCVSSDVHRVWHCDDASQLRRYNTPALPCDLSEGFERYQPRDENKRDNLDPILQFIVHRARLHAQTHSSAHKPAHPPAQTAARSESDAKKDRAGDKKTDSAIQPRASASVAVSASPSSPADKQSHTHAHVASRTHSLSHARTPASSGQSLSTPMAAVVGSANIITWRGALLRLMCTPYNNNEGWRFAVCQFQNRYYINEEETEQHKQRRLTETERQKLACYWGYRFESYASVDRNTDKPDSKGTHSSDAKHREKDTETHAHRHTDRDKEAHTAETVVVNTNACYCAVVKAKLADKHSILMAGEVDCCMSSGASSDDYVELKTHKIIETERDNYFFERVVGFRDAGGVLRKVQQFRVDQIPQMVKGKQDLWSPAVCMTFLDEFFSWMRQCVSHAHPAVFVFEFRPKERRVGCVRDAQQRSAFLPSWFVKEMS